MARLIRVLEQAFAILLLLDLAGVLQQRIERAVLRDQIARALVANAGHALHVVARIAHQRQHVDHLAGRHAELLDDALGVEPRAFILGVVDADLGVHQLEEILVAGDNRGLQTVPGRLARQRPDHIVCLEAFRREDRHAQRFARLEHPRHLLDEISGHGSAVGLVVGRHLRAERLAAHVERRRDVLRLVVGNQLAEHGDETVDRVGGLAVGPRQPANRVIGAIHLVAAVDQEQCGSGWHEAVGHPFMGCPGHRPYIIR